MPATLQVQFGFVIDDGVEIDRRTGRIALRQASWFGHIEASAVRFVVQALMVSGDNGLSAGG
jgi:hypothetical protein